MNEIHITDSFPLTFAHQNESVKLTEVRAGEKLRRRLTELGLHIGMTVRIVQGNGSGPIILAVHNDSRIAIGRGMAQKMMVTRLKGEK